VTDEQREALARRRRRASALFALIKFIPGIRIPRADRFRLFRGKLQ